MGRRMNDRDCPAAGPELPSEARHVVRHRVTDAHHHPRWAGVEALHAGAKPVVLDKAEICRSGKSATTHMQQLLAGMGKATDLAAYQRSLPLAAEVAGGKLAALREADSLLAQLTARSATAPSGTAAALAAMKHEMAALNLGVAKSLAHLGPARMMGGFQGAMAALMEAAESDREMLCSDFPFKWVLGLPINTVRALYERWKARDVDGMYRLLTVELVDNDDAEAFAANCREIPLIRAHADIMADALWAHQQGRYSLSVLASMTQTEGILRGIGVAVGAMPTPDGPAKYWSIGQVLKQSEVAMARTAETPETGRPGCRVGSLKGMFSGPFLAFMIDEFFKRRRNPVLHGNKTDYATVEFSAECLLALNEVIQCAVEVQEWLHGREET